MPRLPVLLQIAACALLATAAPGADPPLTGLSVDLVSEVTHIQPGTPFYAGLVMSPEPGYHTYWKEPGIVGVPTTLQWQLPPGWVAGELEFPEPERVLMFTIKAQGFKRQVLLQTKITPPADLQAGGSTELKGKAVWMCCARTCHPGFKDLTLALPVRLDPPALNAEWHPLFEQERARKPATSDGWTATARQLSATRAELILTPATPAARALTAELAAEIIFFTEDGWIDSDDPHDIRLMQDGALRLELPVSKGRRDKPVPDHLQGLLSLPGGWHQDGTLRTLRIAPALEKASPAAPTASSEISPR